jgi:hypothetical protein
VILVRCRAESEAGVGVVGLGFGNIGGELAGEVGIHHGLRVEDELAEGFESHERARGDEAVRWRRPIASHVETPGFKSQPLQCFEGFCRCREPAC